MEPLTADKTRQNLPDAKFSFSTVLTEYLTLNVGLRQNEPLENSISFELQRIVAVKGKCFTNTKKKRK